MMLAALIPHHSREITNARVAPTQVSRLLGLLVLPGAAFRPGRCGALRPRQEPVSRLLSGVRCGLAREANRHACPPARRRERPTPERDRRRRAAHGAPAPGGLSVRSSRRSPSTPSSCRPRPSRKRGDPHSSRRFATSPGEDGSTFCDLVGESCSMTTAARPMHSCGRWTPQGPDVQFNHVWSVSRDPDAYTALWHLCATPAFLAKCQWPRRSPHWWPRKVPTPEVTSGHR